MQPTYLPWSGYFNLIGSVDVFVFLDCVQYDRRSWQSRNRIMLQGIEHLLSLPVKKMPRETPLNKIQASSHTDWRSKHISSLSDAYKKTEYGPKLLQGLCGIYAQNTELVSAINIDLITFIANYIGLSGVEFVAASELNCEGKRSELLSNICHELDCDRYLSPIGSREYLMDDRFEERSGLKLEFQSYNPQPYFQPSAPSFVSHLSIVDVICNIGPEATKMYCREEV